jgi:hypothetical protein
MKIYCMIKIDRYGEDCFKRDYDGIEVFSTLKEAETAGEEYASGYACDYETVVIDTDIMKVVSK